MRKASRFILLVPLLLVNFLCFVLFAAGNHFCNLSEPAVIDAQTIYDDYKKLPMASNLGCHADVYGWLKVRMLTNPDATINLIFSDIASEGEVMDIVHLMGSGGSVRRDYFVSCYNSLMQLLATLNPENVSTEIADTYPVREAARAVVQDSEGKIALLHVSKNHYYKLPGGGIEPLEDKDLALQRECMEEIGCEIKVLGEVGIIIEERKFYHLRQISYCYFAQVQGEKGEPEFTEDEKAEGFEVLWAPYEEALQLLLKNEAIEIEGHSYIVPRDSMFLKTAKRFFQ